MIPTRSDCLPLANSWRSRRKRWFPRLLTPLLLQLTLLLTACGPAEPGKSPPELTIGRHGYSEGRFHKPRAIAISDDDQLFVVDLTARIQVFERDGKFLRSWQTPISDQGRPTGLSFDRHGHLMVADTHYHRILFYEPGGRLCEELTIGGSFGSAPGEFGFVTDVVQDSQGNFYVSEYGENDRIQKFSADRQFLLQWGSHGEKLGQFLRPQSLALDEQDQLWVADACNHRIQIFDATGDEVKLIGHWGVEGTAPGELRYPYGILLADNHVYVTEFGNHRVQQFTRQGQFVRSWGGPGHAPGQLQQPWSLVRDRGGTFFVLDTYNHRIQRFRW